MIELLFIIVALVLFVVLLSVKYNQLKERIHEEAMILFNRWREQELEFASMQKAEVLFEKWKQAEEEQLRRDAIKRSTAVITGKVAEHLAPYLPPFKFNPKDARFIGSPIDLIVFDGLNDGEVRQIVFVEIKTGKKPSMNQNERLVKRAVEEKRVTWELVHIEKQEM